MARAKFLVLLPLFLFVACAGPGKKTAPPEPVAIETPKPQPTDVYYTVRGKKYYILETSAGYDECGLATWYGGRFHDRKTASGERFSIHKLTAAHKTLPFNSVVEVTNPQNGKKVTVRINDRGPFSDTHIIDLSKAAAEAIGMKQTMRLCVRGVSDREINFHL